MIDFLFIFLGGYLLGSIPTAYLIVKWKSNIDIRNAGSGNVGGFNAYGVTGSVNTGILVGVLDGLKGLAAVLLSLLLPEQSYWLSAVVLFGAMMGHIYPIWLQFKGGRGLATTAGGMFILGFSFTLVWCIMWVIGRVFKMEIVNSNLLAIILTPIILNVLPWNFVYRGIVLIVRPEEFILFSCIISVILVLGHRDVIVKIFQKSNKIEENTINNSL
ncbi:MAG: glycerol-3-phosphate acyltransferase [bacterium]